MLHALVFGCKPRGIPRSNIIKLPINVLQDLSGNYPTGSFCQQGPTNRQPPY